MAITIDGTGSISGISAGGLPDGVIQPADLSTGAPSWTSGGVLSFNSGYGSVATAYGCRAWVSFNGTGSTSSNQTVRGSGNVSSVYKNSQGNYTINFATAMPDANYAISGICTEAGYGAEGVRLASTDPTASACVIDTSRYTAQIDVDWVTVMFIR